MIRVSQIGEEADVCISMCEVYLDDQDRLVNWTEELAVAPVGNDVEDLCLSMARMWVDAMCWVPVPSDSLAVGMEFSRAVDQATRNDLAEFIERGGSLLKSGQQ